MAYCKTRTYLNLKRHADRAYARYIDTGCTDAEELFMEYELECADYAHEHEDEIDWEYVANA